MSKGRPDYRQGLDLEAQALDRISTIAKAPTGTTAIFKTGRIENGTSLVHTISDGKTLYLTGVTLGVFSPDVSGQGKVTVRDENNIDQYNLLWMIVSATTDNSANVAQTLQLIPPVEIPEKWDIVVQSDDISLSAITSIVGWEE